VLFAGGFSTSQGYGECKYERQAVVGDMILALKKKKVRIDGA
jgi:hypothetical protein